MAIFSEMRKDIFFADIFRIQYLFEIYLISINIKNSENVVKNVSENLCDGKSKLFLN